MQLTAFQYVRYALNLQSHHDAMACEACSACSSSACMRDICIKTFTNDITEPMESLKMWGETKSKGDIISEIVQFFSISINFCHITSRGFLSGWFFFKFYGTLRIYWLYPLPILFRPRIGICHIFWKLSEINPIPIRLCQVIYCCRDKRYPCLDSLNRV